DLDKIMDLEGDPEFTIVTRMIRSMPQYKVGHKSRVDAIRKYMTEHYPGVILTGASHHGVGLPDCVSQAKAAVESINKVMETYDLDVIIIISSHFVEKDKK